MSEPLLTSNRVYIRLMDQADARHLSEADLRETETWHMEDGRVPTSTFAFEHMLKEHAKPDPPEVVDLAICLRDSGQCIGGIGIRDIDWINRTAETGSWLFSKEHRSQGFGSEAKHLALRYAFETLGLHSIRSEVFASNTRSAAALRKQGYKLAGRLEADVCIKGVYYDVLLFDLLWSEWEAAYAEWTARYGST